MKEEIGKVTQNSFVFSARLDSGMDHHHQLHRGTHDRTQMRENYIHAHRCRNENLLFIKLTSEDLKNIIQCGGMSKNHQMFDARQFG